jgi:hypothetical protein
MKRLSFRRLTYEEALSKKKEADARKKVKAKTKSKTGRRMIYGVKVWTLKKADTEYSKFLREKRGYRCEKCGYYEAPPTQRIQCSHYLGRSYKAIRFDDDNCDVLCATCHHVLEDAKQYEYREWKIAKLGQEKHDELWRKANNSQGEKHSIYELMVRLKGKDFTNEIGGVWRSTFINKQL